MYQRQQNTLFPKSGRYCEGNLLKLLIGSQPIIEGRSLICGRRAKHDINIDNATKYLLKSATFGGKGYFAAGGTL